MTARAAFVLGAVALLGASCAPRPTIRDAVPPPWLSSLEAAPLAVENVSVSSSQGYHAIFFKLSRFPDKVSDSVGANPARIHLELAGPAGGKDLPEERIMLADSFVHAVRMSRTNGNVHITMEVEGNEAPYVSVHEMADWVMVRTAPRH